MSHEDAGRYAEKHTPETKLNAHIAELVKQYVSNGKISCADAHKIAQQLEVSPAEVGMTIDLLEIKLNQCQLGLFGYKPQRRILEPAEQVSPELKKALEDEQTDNRISCFSSWDIAQTFGISRLDVAAACEALDLKIASCQLGAF